nr:response regulator [Candidatus Kapabacteria bacterium]
GQEALEASQSQEFDVILMDVQLPDISGIEVTINIRENSSNFNQNTPVIAITGHSTEEHKNECLAAGFNSFITKPYSWDFLFKEINRLTNDKKNNNVNNTDKKNNNSVVNLEKLLVALNGNKTVLNHLIDYYNKNYIEELNEIKRAMESDEFNKIGHIVHRIKSEVGNFDALNAVEIARKIELKSKENEKNELQILISSLESEMIKIANELSDIKID